jgi:hypothetical protein
LTNRRTPRNGGLRISSPRRVGSRDLAFNLAPEALEREIIEFRKKLENQSQPKNS